MKSMQHEISRVQCMLLPHRALGCVPGGGGARQCTNCSPNNLKKKGLLKWNSRAERGAATTNHFNGAHVLGGFAHDQMALHSSGRWLYPPLDMYFARFCDSPSSEISKEVSYINHKQAFGYSKVPHWHAFTLMCIQNLPLPTAQC